MQTKIQNKIKQLNKIK